MSTVLTGAAGEYFVAAMLSQAGWAASITPRNADRVDLLAQHIATNAVVSIQVKTSSGAKQFRMSANDESPQAATMEWYACVLMGEDIQERPRFFVVPRIVVSALLYLDHRHFLATPSKSGAPHRDSPQRLLRVADIEAWEESWAALTLEPYPRMPIWSFAAYQAYGLPPEHPLTCHLRDLPGEKTPASSRDADIVDQISRQHRELARFASYLN